VVDEKGEEKPEGGQEKVRKDSISLTREAKRWGRLPWEGERPAEKK